MQDNSTFFEKLAILKHWHPYIIETVRKDLKKDHLQRDPTFVKKYLPGKSPVKVTLEEMVAGYSKAFEDQYNNESIAEFITNRWLLKAADIYQVFEQQLTRINPDVTQINQLTNTQAEPILKDAIAQFGAPDVYLFCRLNCVALPEDLFEKLDQQARTAHIQRQKEQEKQQAHENVESMKTHYEQQIARLTDRFEKKDIGLGKKVHTRRGDLEEADWQSSAETNRMTFPFSIQPQNDDERFMLEALKQAWRAYQADEVPVGAVLVLEGRIIARGYNQVELLHDATAHAEMLCMTAGENAMQDWRLLGTTLYCTIEPCTMCAGAMLLTRIENLVWGAPDIRHGANGSWVNVFDKKHPTHEIKIRSGVLADPCATLLRDFFKNRGSCKTPAH